MIESLYLNWFKFHKLLRSNKLNSLSTAYKGILDEFLPDFIWFQKRSSYSSIAKSCSKTCAALMNALYDIFLTLVPTISNAEFDGSISTFWTLTLHSLYDPLMRLVSFWKLFGGIIYSYQKHISINNFVRYFIIKLNIRLGITISLFTFI